MADDPAVAMKTRLRQDLRTATKGRRADEISILRSLVAALDNAEAPAATSPAAAEVERLLLTDSQVRDVLRAEIGQRDQAANEFERLGHPDRAESLRVEVGIARRYLN
jgi:uncharacterized protein